MSDYLDIVYNRSKKPLTAYPEQLVDHIIDLCSLDRSAGLSLIEPGVGCGDHLRIFRDKGFNVKGLDISSRSMEMPPDLDIDVMDSDGVTWPYAGDTFDVVFSKSFIEHLRDPEVYMAEAFRVLKPGGMVINLTPDWVSNYKKFFDDYTHKSPFTTLSLKNITIASGFSDVEAFSFRQLPFTWKYKPLDVLCSVAAPFVPFRTQIKILRWSRELMLIGYGIKKV